MTTDPGWFAAGGLCGAAGAYAWGAMWPGSQLFGPTVRHTGDESSVALTFDDGPNPTATSRILDLLAQHNLQATFYVIGQHVRAFPELAKEIVARGHAIGNHTDTHPSLALLSAKRIRAELDRCDEAIGAATGKKANWMRPPYGFRSPMLNGIVTQRGNAGVAMWSVMARDWKPQPAQPVIERLRGTRGGDIVLLHDGDHQKLEGDRGHVVTALEYWLPRWKDAGLRFVTMDEMTKVSGRPSA
ncbi:MAG TPA: polysaccharide deacetylase family protein [Candidatus Acidoferrales bacterium]